MSFAYLAVGCINHDEVDACTGDLAEMAIQDRAVAPTVVSAVWLTPEMPGAWWCKAAAPLFDICDIWWWTTSVS